MSNPNVIKVRAAIPNINTKEYLNNTYKDSHWRDGYGGAIVRLEKEVGLIDQPFNSHLDVGCADGTFTRLLENKFPQTQGYGVDLSDIVIPNDPHFVAADCYNLPFSAEYFDLVHSAELLEHLEEPERAIEEMKRVLKPGGTLMLTTVNEYAAAYEEHLWRWNLQAILEMVKDMEIISAEQKFFENSILRVVAKKYD